MTTRLLNISRAATLATIVVMAWQVNLPVYLPQFDAANLPLPYLLPAVSLAEITAVIAIATFALAGWPNDVLLRSGWHRAFALFLVGLVLFEIVSIAWSAHRGLAAVQAVHALSWVAFALLIACADWPAAAMASAFLVGLCVHSLAGLIQISLQPLVQITPQNSGISVVFNATQHLQRVYGLSPHPNVLGGHLAVGAILTGGLIIMYRRFKRILLSAAWLMIWIALLLTFSRSAWLAVVGGGISAVILLLRSRQFQPTLIKPLALLSGAGLIAAFAFAVWFWPFLINRIAITTTFYETQAITERLRSAEMALRIFAAHPLNGVGMAQSIVTAQELAGSPLDWIHNVPLLIATELGVGGILLVGLAAIALAAIAARRWRTQSIYMWQALIGGGLIALVIVMQFDHYIWTMAQGGLLWAWLAGWWMRADH